MTIKTLRINNFRNLCAVQIHPVSLGLNVICGDNGAGKTSVLEAIFYLSTGKSFRTSTNARLIQHDSSDLSLYSQLLIDDQRLVSIGMFRDLSGQTRLRIDESDAKSMAELARFLPIRLINSQSHQIFESGPAYRRKYIDWGLFYQNPAFLPAWRQYERVFKQRNMVLQQHKPKRELDPWTDELIKYGIELDVQRREYVSALTPILSELVERLLGITNLTLTYQAGWDESLSFADALAQSYIDDMRFGNTQCGPQRADLNMTIDDVPVKHFLSRGQQKLLICAMIIAQGKLLAMSTNQSVTYLIDDLPAELDVSSRQKLLVLFSEQPTQIFITAIERNSICDLLGDTPTNPVEVFHVEHGNIVEMAEPAAV